jgi:putative N-acetyltransferase (TIGR04045 family)
VPSELRLDGAEHAVPTRPRQHSAHAHADTHGHTHDRGEIVCHPVDSDAARDEHLAIRHQVFVVEQQIFSESDLDEHDTASDTIAVLGLADDVVVGTVRLFPLDETTGDWQGDRLAVLPRHRTLGAGGPLVRYAVATAGALGGRTMTAHIQPANVAFFQRLGWTVLGDPEIYAGIPHRPMTIDLPAPTEARAALRRLETGINGRDRSPR